MNKKKKILLVGPAYPLRGGGITTFNERLCQQFLNDGYECEILSFKLQYPSFLFPGKTQLSNDLPPKNLTIHTQLNSINPINWIKVGLAFKNKHYNLVVFRYWLSFMAPCLGTLARILKFNKNTKLIAITDNVIQHEPRFFDNWLTRYFLAPFDGFLTLSEAVKTDLLKFNVRAPIAVVPHPIYDNFGDKLSKQEAREKLKLPQFKKVILFFGFIREYKGLHVLLNSMANQALKELDITLLVAGEFYEKKEPYTEQVNQLGISNNVVFVDEFIANNQVAQYFCAADLVVQPYLTATQSGVTQIAYHFNKPMVVTNVGALPELVPHNKVGFVTDVDANEVALAIAQFYNQRLEQTFANNINLEKQRFSWHNLTKQLMHLTHE